MNSLKKRRIGVVLLAIIFIVWGGAILFLIFSNLKYFFIKVDEESWLHWSFIVILGCIHSSALFCGVGLLLFKRWAIFWAKLLPLLVIISRLDVVYLSYSTEFLYENLLLLVLWFIFFYIIYIFLSSKSTLALFAEKQERKGDCFSVKT